MKRKLSVSLLILGLMAGLCMPGKGAVTIFIQAGYYTPDSSTLNLGVIPSINRGLQDFSSSYELLGFSTELDEMGNIGQGRAYGLGMEFDVSRRISLSLETKYWHQPLTAFADANGQILGNTYDLKLTQDLDSTLIPIVATLRYYLPLKGFRLFAGIGLGYYIAMIRENVGYNLDIDNENYYTITGERQSIGYSLIPSIDAGIALNIARMIFLRVDIIYTSGKIKSFEIMSSTLNPKEVGETLHYFAQAEEEMPYTWELRGINLGLSIGIRF